MSEPRPWEVLRRETVYESPWVNVHQDDVRLPDGSEIQGHHVVEIPRRAVCVVPVSDDGRILLIEHYRFITDTLQWEVPAGGADPDEELEDAGQRELLEETGFTARRLEYLGAYYPANGISTQIAHAYVGRGLREVTQPTDTNEALRVAWFTREEVWAMIAANEIQDGISLNALLWHFARGWAKTEIFIDVPDDEEEY